jgi:hypothetical protein
MADNNKKGASANGAKNKKNGKFGAGFVLGAGAVAALATGYFLYGPKGKEHRKQVRAWTVKAKGEVLQELERMKNVSKESYDQVIDKTTKRYEKVKDISQDEADKLNKELKRYWSDIKKEAANGVQDGKKTAKSLRKKIVKKRK